MSSPTRRRWPAHLLAVPICSFALASCDSPSGTEASEEDWMAKEIAEARAEWSTRDIDTVAGRLYGRWVATDASPYGMRNTRWFAADGTCALQTRWEGRNEEPAAPKLGTYEIVGQEGDRLDLVFSWPDDEADDEPGESRRVVWSFTIDAAARFTDVVYVRAEGDVVTEGEPFMMRYESTEESPGGASPE